MKNIPELMHPNGFPPPQNSHLGVHAGTYEWFLEFLVTTPLVSLTDMWKGSQV